MASGPPASFASPVNASASPSMAPKVAGPPPSVDVRKVGSKLVTISWLESLNSDAAPTPSTPGVSQRSEVGCWAGGGGLISSVMWWLFLSTRGAASSIPELPGDFRTVKP